MKQKFKIKKAKMGSLREAKLLKLGWEPIGIEAGTYVIFRAPITLKSDI